MHVSGNEYTHLLIILIHLALSLCEKNEHNGCCGLKIGRKHGELYYFIINGNIKNQGPDVSLWEKYHSHINIFLTPPCTSFNI